MQEEEEAEEAKNLRPFGKLAERRQELQRNNTQRNNNSSSSSGNSGQLAELSTHKHVTRLLAHRAGDPESERASQLEGERETEKERVWGPSIICLL